jgi:hypothetical protein
MTPAMRAAYEGIEEDMMPRNICGNCLAVSTRANPVRYDGRTDRRLCRECEPSPARAHR